MQITNGCPLFRRKSPLYRPRDLLLFFKPLENGAYSIPLDRYAISSLINQYSMELGAEIKNELSSFYNDQQIETIFSALGRILQVQADHARSKGVISEYCKNVDADELISRLLDRSVLGARDDVGRFFFKSREPLGSAVSLKSSDSLVVCYGLRPYLQKSYIGR